MYISKRKKNRQQIKAIVDEFFTNGYISADSLSTLFSILTKKNSKFWNTCYAAREAKWRSENKDKKIVG